MTDEERRVLSEARGKITKLYINKTKTKPIQQVPEYNKKNIIYNYNTEHTNKKARQHKTTHIK